MKRLLHCGFLLMGFSFTVTQGLLIRELLVAFFGNELSIGLILGKKHSRFAVRQRSGQGPSGLGRRLRGLDSGPGSPGDLCVGRAA